MGGMDGETKTVAVTVLVLGAVTGGIIWLFSDGRSKAVASNEPGAIMRLEPPKPAAPPADDDPLFADKPKERRAFLREALRNAKRLVTAKKDCGDLTPDNYGWRHVSAAWK